MDGNLPDFLTHFIQAGQMILPDVKPVLALMIENGKDITAAFGESSPLTLGQKLYHGSKLTAFSGLLTVSALTLNLEGSIPSAFVVGEEIKTLDEIGHKTRILHSSEERLNLS